MWLGRSFLSHWARVATNFTGENAATVDVVKNEKETRGVWMLLVRKEAIHHIRNHLNLW